MSRPAKPIAVAVGARTNAEIRQRAENEKRLKGDKLETPTGLTPAQTKIAEGIIEGLASAEILGKLDDTVVRMAAFAIDGIQQCISEQNENTEQMNDPNFRAKLKKYEETFEKACRELGLSPQARAKLAIAGTAKDDSLEAIKNIIGGTV